MNRQSGFSLTELLISLFLTSLISALLIQAYVANKRQYLALHKLLEINFDVQWVNDLLSNSIRHAGFTPCLRIDQLEAVDVRSGAKSFAALNFDKSGLYVHRMSEHFGELIAIHNSNTIEVSKEALLHKKQALLIADCYHAEIHRIVQIEQSANSFLLTLAKPLLFQYPSATYAGAWLDEQWFIQSNVHGVKALYYKLVHSEEITALIHSMSLKKRMIQGKMVVDVMLGLDKGKTHHLKAVIRS
jgi:prepilin-type N-terminal cleavage/methylation domain-containing protein